MLGELENARVMGLDYQDIQVHIIRLVKSFIKKQFPKYPILEKSNIDREDIEVKVYQRLYNRESTSDLSNMERYFIYASSLGAGADKKYLVCLLKRVVCTSILELSRTYLSRKVSFTSYDIDDYDLSSDSYLDYISFSNGYCVEDIDYNLSYQEALSKVPSVSFNYTVCINGKRERLTSRVLLDLLVSGYTNNDIKENSRHIDTGKPIGDSNYSRIKKDTITLAKENLKDYLKG